MQSRNTGLMAVGLTAAALGLAGCGSGGSPGAAGTSTVTMTVTASEPVQSPSTSRPPVVTSTTRAPQTCLSRGLRVGAPNVAGVSGAAASRATSLYQAAKVCDQQSLVRLATRHTTRLSFGLVTPKQAFVVPQDSEKRYDNLVRVLSSKPGVLTMEGQTTYIWPRVSADETVLKDRTAWQEAVDAGLITAQQAKQMQAGGTGYLGYRVGITSTGQWQYFIAGD